MEMIFVLVSILQSIAISLGVGCSTLAIINFFVAIADGKIDETERKMMGIVYILLRVAMVAILVTSIAIALVYLVTGSTNFVTPYMLGMWTLVTVLYVNAVLMTKHVMPSNIGPALQAGTWYTLGILASLVPLGLAGFSYFEFIVGYGAAVALAIALVNGTMAYLKERKEAKAM